MLSTMNLTIINEEELSPLLHTGAPVTSLDRHTGMTVILELTKSPSREVSQLPPKLLMKQKPHIV